MDRTAFISHWNVRQKGRRRTPEISDFLNVFFKRKKRVYAAIEGEAYLPISLTSEGSRKKAFIW